MVSLGAGLFAHQGSRNREVFRSICDLTENNFYKEDAKLNAWVAKCRRLAAQVPGGLTKAQLVEVIQDHMSGLNVSHYLIYSPAEDKKMWTGVAVDTGIRSRYVEDHLVVYKIIPGSGALKAGVRPGDEIIGITGTEQVTPWGAQNRSGTYSVMRGEDVLNLEVTAAELITESGPEVTPLRNGSVLLEIPSFRSEYFEAKKWRETAAGLRGFHHVIVDLRQNAGGNFVAMLRALSFFHCQGKSMGVLVRPRKPGEFKPAFEDNTEDSFQIQELEKYQKLGLVTFDGYGCYPGNVTVLIGSDTSSVSEIFAHSFFSRLKSRVWGQPSAGDVVLAVWYDLPALGKGYSISIPEAVYLTPEEKELENEGVFPQKEIFYDLKLSLQGKDTFVEEALR